MTTNLPEVILQSFNLKDLEFLPIGTPVISADSAVINFLHAVRAEVRHVREVGATGAKSERWITDIEFKTGFGLPEGAYDTLSCVTSYYIECDDHYQVIVSPRLDELERFYTEGYDYWCSLPDPENGTRELRLFIHKRDNPYDPYSPMGMAWYEGFLRARGGRPNPFRKE